LVHCDIKPANIFLSRREDEDGERVKILDFGLLKPFDPTDISISSRVVGTPGYMAPEQVLGHRVTPRTDLWALGVVLYEALTGQPLFTDQRVLEILSNIVSAPIPPPSTVAPDLSDDVDAFFARALARPPEERFQSADELSMAFMALAAMQNDL